MYWIAVLVGLALLLRAVDQRRVTHWWSFSPLIATGTLILTWVLLAVVSALGIATERRIMGSNSTIATDLGAALLSQASLRRLRTRDPGGTLVLGFLPDLHRWGQHFIDLAVERWATRLGDDQLLQAAAHLNNARRLPTCEPPSEKAIRTRAKWLLNMNGLLRAGGQVRAQAREDLIRMITLGYTKYLMRKP